MKIKGKTLKHEPNYFFIQKLILYLVYILTYERSQNTSYESQSDTDTMLFLKYIQFITFNLYRTERYGYGSVTKANKSTF